MTDHAISRGEMALAPREPGPTAAAERFERAFRAEELAGLKLAIKCRAVALVAVVVMLFFIVPAPDVYYYDALIVVFIALGFANYWLAAKNYGRPWLGYLFVALDMVLLSYTLMVPNPLSELSYAPQLQLRNGLFTYFFLLVAAIAFTYSPRLMLWAGLVCVLSWGIGAAWLISLPGTITGPDPTVELTREVMLAAHLDPKFVDINVRIQEIVLMLLVVGALAGVVWRSRRLVISQATSARERANLARYFPPTIVDQLADLDQPLGAVRAQPVAVMFADIVGFTRLAEKQEPGQIIGLLRQFHALMERAIFDHGGTLDKFLGDGVMTTFGTPSAGQSDAANALRCTHAMLAAVQAWNAERARAGQAPVRLSIGIHYGDVVMGDIGSERRLEFAVLGDVVNVASRLEERSRQLDCQVVVSDELVRQARREAGAAADPLLAKFQVAEPQTLRGRDEPVAVWTLAPHGG